VSNKEPRDVEVFPPGAWENDDGPEDWYAVADEEGIVAYANTDELACAIQRYIRRQPLDTAKREAL